MNLVVVWLRALWLSWWDRLYERFAGATVVWAPDPEKEQAYLNHVPRGR